MNLLIGMAALSKTVMQSLELMGKGMLGIFIVMSIIFLLIILLGKFFKQKDDDK